MSAGRIIIALIGVAIVAWLVWSVTSISTVSRSLTELSLNPSAGASPAVPAPNAALPESSPFPADNAEPAEELSVQEMPTRRQRIAPYIPEIVPPPDIPDEVMQTVAIEGRCQYLEWPGVDLGQQVPSIEYRDTLTDAEWRALADAEEDGFFNDAIGEKLLWDYNRKRSDGAAEEDLEPQLQLAIHYFLRAARHKSRSAAANLATIYYQRDRVESRAWWEINRRMGADTLAQQQAQLNQYWFDGDEDAAGIARADDLIERHDLVSSLAVPEACLTPEELQQQHRMLADWYLPRAERALPSVALDAEPVAFASFNGRTLAVENACSVNCPRDSERLIHFQEVTEAGECAALDGSLRTIDALTVLGTYEERTWCVPNFVGGN